MSGRQQFVDEQGPVSRIEYPDGSTVLAADVGPGRDANVDIVDDTVMVVVGDEQYDFELPVGSDAQAFIKNGVLTVEVNE
jgi:HSP20 family molecular chaperone IbpA